MACGAAQHDVARIEQCTTISNLNDVVAIYPVTMSWHGWIVLWIVAHTTVRSDNPGHEMAPLWCAVEWQRLFERKGELDPSWPKLATDGLELVSQMPSNLRRCSADRPQAVSAAVTAPGIAYP